MSNNDALRQAAQQALEALNHVNVQDRVEIINNLRAALAKPVQEQVALNDGRLWQYPDGSIGVGSAPHPRKRLTDEQIRDLWSWAMTAEAELTATAQQHAFARAIERAHGIEE